MDPVPEVSERVLAARSLMEKIKTNAPVEATPTPVAASEKPTMTNFIDPRLMGHKDQIIESILKLQQGGLCPPGGKLTQKKLREMKRADLEKLLASFYELGLQKASAPKGAPAQKPMVLKETKDPVTGKVIALSQATQVADQTAVNMLWHFHQIAIKFTELASVNARKKFELQTDLEGLTEDLNKSEAELRPILAEIWKQHGTTIAPYMTPVSMYTGFMLGLTTNRAIANQKKESPSPDGLPDSSLRQ